ncbi:AbrB/MazE/SpoVT family DNA-binding domain-containing protein [Streptococcus devriesei]|uniref:AbrB/MazE/SpoVT family DNA-binding domain-containing protein n=1 Tax=Streptococcus devriesei TaxID=231233 RepID=UPI0003FC2E94|nr:AbrB/MazE/SpoVT family DNA-binding domain-containing protein [Streptococcus devriesei]
MNTLKTEERQVRKWGNGLGLHIPKTIADKLDLSIGDNVVFDITDHDSIMIKVKRPENEVFIPKYNFSDLLSSKDQQVTELDWGTPQGEERI